MPDDGLGGERKETGPDAAAHVPSANMQVVEQGSPRSVVVEDRVSEADQRLVGRLLDEDRARSRVGLSQPLAPHLESIVGDVAVEERVRVGAPIMTAPAIRMEGGDSRRVLLPSLTELETI
jgi:hypothetical protein